MIQSKSDYYYYLEADRIALSVKRPIGGGKLLIFNTKQLLSPSPIWAFEKSLRKVEYLVNCKHGMLARFRRFFAVRKYNALSLKLGFTIPINTCGPGLAIAHYGSIVINSNARLGENCLIHSGVNIGTQAGYSDRAPKIGNNCYIGPGAKIFGAVSIADNTAIGANAVVNKSSNEEHVLLAGMPATVKKKGVETLDFIRPATLMMKYGYNRNENLMGVPALKVKELLNADKRIYTVGSESEDTLLDV